MSKNFLKEMFINEAKPALKRHSGGSGSEGGSVIVNVPGSWQGTPVPNTGYVENVYFNTELSTKEVVKLLEQLDFIPYDVNDINLCTYTVLITKDGEYSGVYLYIDKIINPDNPENVLFEIWGWGDGGPIFSTEEAEHYMDDGSTIKFIGWNPYAINPLAANAEVFSTDPNWNYGTVGLQNDIISSLLSTTPITKSEAETTILTGEYDGSAIKVTENGNVDIKTFIKNKKLPLSLDVEGSITVSNPGGWRWQGTPVPNSGHVENVYFNTDLSVEEVVEIMSQVDLSNDVYVLIMNDDSSNGIAYAKDYGKYAISDANGNLYFDEAYGWTPDINPIAINSEVIDLWNGMTVGLQNDLISSLFSSTPITKVEDEELTLTGKYDGSTVVIDINEFKGTTVPNTGHVENVYFNTEMSTEEVSKILSKVLTPENNMEYLLYSKNSSDSYGRAIHASLQQLGDTLVYRIYSDFDSITYFSSNSYSDYGSNVTFTGWNPTLTNPVAINVEVMNEYSDSLGYHYSVGTNNAILSSMFSLTPFEKMNSNEYDYDLKTCLNEQKLPLCLKIQLPEPPESTNPLLQLINNTRSCDHLYAYYNDSYYVGNTITPTLNYDDTENVSNFSNMYYKCKYIGAFPELNTSKGTDFSGMYSECTSATSLPELNTSKGINFSNMYNNCASATTFPELNTSNGTDFNNMYNNCTSATTFPELNTSNGTDFNNMYNNCTLATSFPLLNTSKGTDFSGMYYKCTSATSLPELNTSNGTDFNNMYNNCTSATTFPELDTSNGIDFSNMYDYCISATSFPLLDTHNGTDFGYMYYHCNSATTFPELNTSKGTNFSNMYGYCESTTSFPELDTSNGTNFSGMYSKCTSATSFPELITSNGTDFNRMYNKCTSATSFPELITSNGTDFGYMYAGCRSATSFPLLDTYNGTNFARMYSECTSATSVPELDTSNGTSFGYMYYKCTSATSFPELDTHNGTVFHYMYGNCESATSFPELDTSNGTDFNSMYYGCVHALKIDITKFTASLTTQSNQMFGGCRSLKALIIRSFGSSYVLNTTSLTSCLHIIGQKNSTYNPNGEKDGYIYVPRDMIGKLSTATNWSTYASQLRALEDYTKDGTCWGEFDDEKAGLI